MKHVVVAVVLNLNPGGRELTRKFLPFVAQDIIPRRKNKSCRKAL